VKAQFATRPESGSPLLGKLRALFPGGRCACGCEPRRHEFGRGSECCNLVCLDHPGRACGRVFGAGEHQHLLRAWLQR
jgi:hypothetical protein